jgi:hypothetical protein
MVRLAEEKQNTLLPEELTDRQAARRRADEEHTMKMRQMEHEMKVQEAQLRLQEAQMAVALKMIEMIDRQQRN